MRKAEETNGNTTRPVHQPDLHAIWIAVKNKRKKRLEDAQNDFYQAMKDWRAFSAADSEAES